MKRLLTLLAAVLMLVCLPMVASAETVEVLEEVEPGYWVVHTEEVVRETVQPYVPVEFPEPVNPAGVEEDGDSLYFDTLEDLKSLAKKTYDSTRYVYYRGSEPLVISENLTLPSQLYLQMYQQELTVAKGVTLKLDNYISVGTLTVNGTMYAAHLDLFEKLTVSGTLYLKDGFSLDENVAASVTGKLHLTGTGWVHEGATLIGKENIVFAGKSDRVYIKSNVKTMEALSTVAKTAAADGERFWHQALVSGDLVVTSSVTFPKNCEVEISAYQTTLTVNQGSTLTFNCYVRSQSPIVVYGKLVNNYEMSLSDSWQFNTKSSLTIADGGSYSGNGMLYVYDVEDPAEKVIGISMDGFDVSRYSSYFVLRYVGDLKKLASPSDLTWGTLHGQWRWNPETKETEEVDIPMPGALSFRVNEPNQNRYQVWIYKEGEGIVNTFTTSQSEFNTSNILSFNNLCEKDIDSGRYSFSVVSKGDYETCRDSDVAASAIWEYTKPSKSLGTVQNMRWEKRSGWNYLVFDKPEDDTYIGGYSAECYFSATKNGTPEKLSMGFGVSSGDFDAAHMDDYITERYGEGYYYLKIRLLSSDITKRCNGEWSVMSPAYHYTGAPEVTEPEETVPETTEPETTEPEATEPEETEPEETEPVKPAAPRITGSNVASTGKPRLTWTKVEGAVKYEIWRSTKKNSGFTRIWTQKSTTYTNTKAEAGKLYYYKVKAVDASGNVSDFSNRISRTCDLKQPVVKVSNDAATGKVKLTWAKVEGAKSYKVYRATARNGKYSLMKTVTGTSYINNSAKAGKTYYYKVIAVHSNSNANSAYSAIVSRMCDLARPVISVKRSDTGKPRISWKKVEGAVKYEVYRATSKNGTYKRIATTKNLYQVNKNAKAGVTYYYKVKAIHSNTNANSAFSLPKYMKAK